MKHIILAMLLAAAFIGHAQAEENKDIIISHAWVEIVPPVEKVTAAYMEIANNGKEGIILDSVSTPVARVTEIHEMSRANGMMKMRMLKNLPIPAGGKVILQPGGNHLMLIDLAQPVVEGDIVPVTLHFHNGTSVVVNAEAKPEML